MMTDATWLSLWLAVGGALGVVVRVFLTNGQKNISRESVQDVLLGALIGYLWSVPLPYELPIIGVGWPPFTFPETARVGQKAAMVGGFTWLTAEVIKRLLMRYKPAWLDRYSGNGKDEPKETPPPAKP